MEPAEYLDTALDYIRENAYFIDHIVDWQALHTRAHGMIQAATTTADTYPTIRMVLEALADRHSYLVAAPQPDQATESASNIRLPQGHRHAEHWGYLALPDFLGSDEQALHYAHTGQQIIRDVGTVNGWIVDLRLNTGGNMWPMLVVIGPLAGEGILGSFTNRKGQKDRWGYREGSSYYESAPAYESESAYTIANPVPAIADNIPIALLISDKTASSGEITLIGFLGRPNIRTFGATATRGVPTANETYDLPDGAFISLTVALTADRTGSTYQTAIKPIVLIEGEDDPQSENSPVLMAALEWLRQVG